MYRIIDSNKFIYKEYQYKTEEEFENIIVDNSKIVFGNNGIYFNIKKKIGINKKGKTIPDGYYLDLKSYNDPSLYLIEVELDNHDLFSHIGQQMLKFAVSSDDDKYKIKTILLDDLNRNIEFKKMMENYLSNSKYKNQEQLLDYLIFEKDVSVIIIINEISDQLNKLISKINIKIDLLEMKSYIYENKLIHKFTPFQEDIIENIKNINDFDELDTIVVPAKTEGFKDVFIGKNCWYQIRISSAMLSKIKYIAVYQTAPISAITHIAEVSNIEKYKDSNKYIIYFKGEAKEINKISTVGNMQGVAPQSPRYTTYSKITKAKKLEDLWE